MYSANKTTGQWRAHGRYIARESAGGAVFRSGTNGIGEGGDLAVDPAKELERWQSEGDPRLWKLIVSPEIDEDGSTLTSWPRSDDADGERPRNKAGMGGRDAFQLSIPM